MNIPIEQCVSAKPFKIAPERRILLTSILVALYAIALPYCFFTAGEPRRVAMINAQKLADERWERESQSTPIDANITVSNSAFLETNSSLQSDLKIESGPTFQTFEFTDSNDGSFYNNEKKPSSSTGSSIMNWFGPTMEQKRAQAEFEKWQKSFKDKLPEEGISLPSPYLPSALAVLLLLVTLCGHALFHLLCHWITSFKAMMLFSPCTVIDEYTYILVIPPLNRGKSDLVKMCKAKLSNVLQLQFQRQTYVYTPSGRLGDQASKYPYGVFTLYQAPVNLPLSTYLTSKGLISDGEVEKTIEKWGKNHLKLHIPSFVELLQKQLLSPLAIFQIFCALLWLLDEYWSYTVWSLASVVIFESTSVFQRTRTQTMLGGMSPKASPIYVYRSNKWVMMSTEDLLPGDLISVAYQRPTVAASNTTITTTTSTTSAENEGTGTSPSNDGQQQLQSQIEGEEKQGKPSTNIPITAYSDIVPCDCVLLTGSAIVNEASLTGESVPQMKEALSSEDSSNNGTTNTVSTPSTAATTAAAESTLDINGQHRVHTLFSGTSIITIRDSNGGGSNDAINGDNIPLAHRPDVSLPPDHGAIAYVLRTGFSSSQGALLQMIEFSQQTVSGDSVEIGYALLLLFFFALLASGYVLKEGLRKKEKTTHEILLKCVIIITSVVPKELPMQMAMAVNMALMSLTKAGIFCTEPHRVPLSGKITHCLFDKTGTLTTDQLVPVGIIHPTTTTTSAAAVVTVNKDVSKTIPDLHEVRTAVNETAMILAACHSLVVVDNASSATNSNDNNDGNTANATDEHQVTHHANLVGDPIEVAAMKAVEWSWYGPTSTATPGAWQIYDKAKNNLSKRMISLQAELTELNAKITSGAATQLVHDTFVQGKHMYEKLKNDTIALEDKIRLAKDKAAKTPYSKVQIIQRFHFSSQLQRMSVLCKCTRNTSNAIENDAKSTTQDTHSKSPIEWFCFVKGSPEAVHTLLRSDTTPTWYKSTYDALARRGLRVLALAYKKVDISKVVKGYVTTSSGSGLEHIHLKDISRQQMESDLLFGGFIAFECKIRSDSKIVVQALLQADHKVAMLTGDALLTSLHVAKQVDICRQNKLSIILLAQIDPNADVSNIVNPNDKIDGPCWILRHEISGRDEYIPYDICTVLSLYEKYNMLTTEKDLLAVIEHTGGKMSPLWYYIDCFCVFARMSPTGKATIIRAIQNPEFQLLEDQSLGKSSTTTTTSTVKSAETKHQRKVRIVDAHVLMCGDGGNDVGALKQSDIGLALLAGHANTNTSDDTPGSKTDAEKGKQEGGKESSKELSAEDSLNAREQAIKLRGDAFNAARTVHMKKFQAEYTKINQAYLQEEVRKATESGEIMKMYTIMKDNAMKVKRVMEEENRRFMALHGQIWDAKDGDGLGGSGGGGGGDGIAGMLASLESSDAASAAGLPMIRPGDASVAAPFTSRTPSIKSVVDLIRQGRCTLLSALMQQEIMMLESIISAYTLSALSLHNARSSERQLMASQWLIMIAAISFSYAAPLDHMHPLRPLKSLFHPAIIFSVLGQALIHIVCMTLAVNWATEEMGSDTLKEVTEFFRKVKAKEIDRYAQCGEEDFVCQMNAFWTAPFMPNLLNTVVFLVQTSQMISVFFANYKGRPWMKSMMENHALFLSVFICISGVIVAAWEIIPKMNELLLFTPFPNDAFRYKVVFLVLATIAGTFIWDRICTLFFAPDIFGAIMTEFKKTTLIDFFPIFKTVALVIGGLFILSTGNIVLILVAGYYGRKYFMMKPTPPSPTLQK